MIRVFGWIDQSGALIKTAYLMIPGLGKNPGNSKKTTIKLETSNVRNVESCSKANNNLGSHLRVHKDKKIVTQ